ncbi:MAG: hypothetical protein AAF513_12155 [Pseudomonadota bacterium]
MKAVGELLESFALYAICDDCLRCEPLDLQALIDEVGADYPIERIRLRLRCNACNQRTQGIRIVYIGPQGKAAGFRYA